VTEVTSGLRVHMRHIRAAKQCSGGGRNYFKKYGLSWSDFLQNGIDASILISHNDPLSAPAIAAAREEANGRRR
jgi:hypothetical protein